MRACVRQHIREAAEHKDDPSAVHESTSMRVWIGFVKVLGVLGLFMWLSHWVLFLQYDATRPTAMQPAEGRLYPSFNHGHIVYLTQQEQRRLDILERTAGGLFVIAIPMGFWAKWRLRRKGTNSRPFSQ